MSFFTKAIKVPQSIFTKGNQKRVKGFFTKGGGADQFSTAVGDAGKFLGQAGREVRRYANNDVVQGAANMALGKDRARQLTSAALSGSALMRGGGSLLDQTSAISNPSNFRGSASQVAGNAGNVLEKARKLKGDTQQLFA